MHVLQNHVVALRPQFVTDANVLNLVIRSDVHGAKDIKDFCLRYMVAHPKFGLKEMRALPMHLRREYIAAFLLSRA